MPGITSSQPCFGQRGTHPLLQLSRMLYVQSAIDDLISEGPLCPSLELHRGSRHLPELFLEGTWWLILLGFAFIINKLSPLFYV